MKTCAMIAGQKDTDLLDIELFAEQIPILYHDFGIRKILSGVHRGKELSALDYLLKERKRFPRLKIHGVFTHEEEASFWEETDRERLYGAIRHCDGEWILKPVYGNEMRFQRNIVMMDSANLVFLLGRDTEIEFWASKLNKPLLRLDLAKRSLMPSIRLFQRP